MFNTGNDYYLNFLFLFLETKTLHKLSLVCPYEKKNRKEIYRNFAIFTVTVPLVLPTGTKDSEKFTKISQYSQ
jgi:hypothetical protein